MDAEEAFEQMIQQERELQKQKRGEDEDAEFLDRPSRPNLSSTMAFSQQSFSQSSQNANESRNESTAIYSTPVTQTKPSTPSSVRSILFYLQCGDRLYTSKDHPCTEGIKKIIMVIHRYSNEAERTN